MDFFAQENRVRRSSRRLVVLFVLAVLAIVVAVDAICAFLVGVGLRPYELLAIALAVVVFIGLCSAFRVASLRGGGAAVARRMDASEVPADTRNGQWQRLRNVVEEVAIASGVPVPDIYVMQDEDGINAFAAGFKPTDAVVCVTQGCLDKLNRDELQGVIAHEFSHVLNGDMRVNIRLIGLLFGIMAIGVLGRFVLWGGIFSGGGRRRSSGGGGGGGGGSYVLMAGLALMLVGAIGLFFGKLIQAAVARTRESLADASAVQFTRQTSGIAGALKKILAYEEGSQLQARGRDEVRHMLFGNAEGRSLFATHPPLIKRIQALEPGFDPKQLQAQVQRWVDAGRDPNSFELHAGAQPPPQPAPPPVPADGHAAPVLPGFPNGPAQGAAGAVGGAALAITAAGVSAAVGSPEPRHYQAAAQLHARLPSALAAAARDPRGALAVVFALAISEHPDLRRQQVQSVAQAFDAALAGSVDSQVTEMADLHPMLRLPLAQLAFPALKRRPRAEIRRCVTTLEALIHADGRVDLDEYCLAKLVQIQVVAALDPASGFKPGTRKLADLKEELRDLTALIAHFGNDDEASARRAFQAAMAEALPKARIAYAIPADWQKTLDRSLDALTHLAAAGKQLTVRALARAIAADGKLTLAESDMLRTTCAALDCPLPPILSGGPA